MLIKRMTINSAKQIIKWKYESPYDLYNFEFSEESLNELLDGTYFEVIEKDLIGYFCYGKSAQVPPGNDLGAYDKNYVDIGLGLKPILCGKRSGKKFIENGIDYALENYNCEGIRLTVAEFNKRAYKVYNLLGFKETIRFSKKERVFIVMELNK